MTSNAKTQHSRNKNKQQIELYLAMQYMAKSNQEQSSFKQVICARIATKQRSYLLRPDISNAILFMSYQTIFITISYQTLYSKLILIFICFKFLSSLNRFVKNIWCRAVSSQQTVVSFLTRERPTCISLSVQLFYT